MAVRIHSATLQGVTAAPIEVEVDLLRRLPGVCIVGLAAGAVRESAERVRSAMVSADLAFPRKRVVVNLAPAGLRKAGAAFDLPIAMGILAADGEVPATACESLLFVGELSLSGQLRPTRGALALASLARELGKTLVLPEVNAGLAARVPGVTVLGARSLADVVAHVRGETPLATPTQGDVVPAPCSVDLREVRGQETARRALEIAAAGAHHLLMLGPPGCGKSMLAHRLSTILPPLSFEERLEVTRIHDAAGAVRESTALRSAPPFRAPHHSVTVAGLVGDRTLRPGEVSLAHRGVLFLDEAPEFRRSVLEVLRAPLEDGVVRLVRAEGAITYPAAVTLVMAANPCPCGHRGSHDICECTDTEVARYRRKLSGPILDRIDLHVELQPVPADVLMGEAQAEDSATVRARVVDARARQAARGQTCCNGHLERADLDRVAHLALDTRACLHDAIARFRMSGRASTRVLKVARTIADLDGAHTIAPEHLAEALAFRPVSATS